MVGFGKIIDDDGEDDTDFAAQTHDLLFLNGMDQDPSVSNLNMKTNALQINQETTIVELGRIRQYRTRHQGPFVLVIYELTKRMTPLSFSSYINKTYNFVVAIRIGPGKLKITLNYLADANNVVNNQSFREYYVSIPADQVEVEGVFNSENLCDLTDINVLITNGVGGFYNS